MQQLPKVTRATYYLDLLRAIFLGALEAAAGTFLLLIAIRAYSASPAAKAWLASGTNGALLLTPLVVGLVGALKMRVTTAAALLSLIGAAAYFITFAVPSLATLVFFGLLANSCAVLPTPLMTYVYHLNYPANLRASLYSKAIALRLGSAALFGYVGGAVLQKNYGAHQLLLLSLAVVFIGLALSTFLIPSSVLSDAKVVRPFHAFQAIWNERLIRTTLASWMIMGMANLMMTPLRVEYLGNPDHGLNLSASMVATLTAVVPNFVRLISAPFWGLVFDKINFFKLRIGLNVLLACATVLFFLSKSITGLVVGSMLYGLANSGGDVAWGLWITFFTPPERTPAYMSIHTFLTGVRGLLAPQLGFCAVGYLHTPISALAIGSALLILISGLMLIPLVPYGDSTNCRHS